QEPLRKMQMLGSILRRKAEGQMDDECQIYLNRLIFLSRKMQSMITDVLTLSKVTSKSQPFRKVAGEALVAKTLRHLEPLIQDSGTRIEVGEISSFWGDPAQLRQLLENLLENAIKFSKPDVAPLIRIHSHELGNGYGELIIED